MEQQLVNIWYCNDCDDRLYTDLGNIPEWCPYCKSTDLEDGRVHELTRFPRKVDSNE